LTGDNGIGLQPAWPAINNAFAGQGSPARTAAKRAERIPCWLIGVRGKGSTPFSNTYEVPPQLLLIQVVPVGFASHRLCVLQRIRLQRSEVYAIWVTVGLFEVEYNEDLNGNVIPGIIDLDEDCWPAHSFTGIRKAHRLLREYGRSTGEVKRYRGFYIFDRSRAITYEPGVDHNVDDGLLVERLIQ